MTLMQKDNKKAAKLTVEQVAEIRRLYGEGYTQGSICRHFGVTIGTIGRIVRGESWAEGPVTRELTALEHKGIQQRLLATQAQIERERTFEVGHASPPVTQTMPAAAKFEDALVSDHAKALRDKLLGYDSEPKRASPPPSPLDGGDAPSEVHGEGLAKLEEAAVAEGLDVEIALRRSES